MSVLGLHSSMSADAAGGDTLIQGHLICNQNLVARDVVVPLQHAIKFAPAKNDATSGADYSSAATYSITASASSLMFKDTANNDMLSFTSSAPVHDPGTQSRMIIRYGKIDQELEVEKEAGIRFRDQGDTGAYFEMGLRDSIVDSSKNELFIRHSESSTIKALSTNDELIGSTSADKKGMYPHDLGPKEGGWTYGDLGDYKSEVIQRYIDLNPQNDPPTDDAVYTGPLYKAWPSQDRSWMEGDLYYTDREPVISIRDDEVRLGVNLYIDGTLTVKEGTQASFGDVANFSKDVGMDGALTVVGSVRANNNLTLSNASATHTVLSGFNVAKTLKTTTADGDLNIFDKFTVDAETGLVTAHHDVDAKKALTVGELTTLQGDVKLEKGAKVPSSEFLIFTNDAFDADLFKVQGGASSLDFKDSLGNNILELNTESSTFSSVMEIRSADKSKLKMGTVGGHDSILLDGNDQSLKIQNLAGSQLISYSGSSGEFILKNNSQDSFKVDATKITAGINSHLMKDLVVGPQSKARALSASNEVYMDSKQSTIEGKEKLVLAAYDAHVSPDLTFLSDKALPTSTGTGNAFLISEQGETAVLAKKSVTIKSDEGIVLENTSSAQAGLTIKTAGDVTFEGDGKLAFAVKVMTLDTSAGNPYFLTAARAKELADSGDEHEGRMYVDENGLVRVIRKDTASAIQYQGAQGVNPPADEQPTDYSLYRWLEEDEPNFNIITDINMTVDYFGPRQIMPGSTVTGDQITQLETTPFSSQIQLLVVLKDPQP